jgi:hypothetical protein
MKHISACLLLLLGSSLLFAQIPNAGFEDWTSGNPDGWITANSPNTPFVTQVGGSHSGSSALKSEIISVQGFPVGAPLATGSQATDGYFPVNGREEAIHGWIKSDFLSGDKLNIALSAKQAGAPVGAGLLEITANNSSWTPFTINITYQNGTVIPDSIAMTFTIRGQSSPNAYHIGSYFMLDDLTYGTATAISNPMHTIAWQALPNPSTGIFHLQGNSKSLAQTGMRLYDMQGRLLQEWQPGESSTMEISLENHAPGIYLLDIMEGTQVTQLRLIRE